MTMKSSVDRRDRPAKFGAAWVSFIFCAFGVHAVVTRDYHGHSSRLGGATVHLTGLDAVIAGSCIIAFGLMPLALLAPNGRVALIWSMLCAVAGIGLLATLLV